MAILKCVRLKPLYVTLAGCVLLAGCGSGQPLQIAKGQVLANGKNYQVGDREQLLIIFYPVIEEGEPSNTYPANVKKDGSFDTTGRDGKGIPPGKYRVMISSPYGGGAVEIPKELGSPQSPITREVVLGKDILEPIDVLKPG